MAKYVFEVLDLASKGTKANKVKVLKENESIALKDVLRATLDSTIQFSLPDGDPPPYEEAEPHNHPANLLRENMKFKYFVKGTKASAELPGFKRERIFLAMLEAVHPNDAKVLIDMINKKAPKGITRDVVKEAFPGLLRD